MFKKSVVLSSEVHANLKFNAVGGFSYAKNLHMVPICATEFYLAAREYPIVFAKAQDEYVPVVITGLKEGENLYVDDAGFWSAKYVPATIRAYPFGFVNQDEENSLVLIDEAYEGFSQKDGTPLFDASKALTKDLEMKLDFLRQHKGQVAVTKEFVRKLQEHDLLIERVAQFGNLEKPEFQVNGVWVIDEKKLYALKDKILLDLTKKGYLALATAQLMSMQSFGELFQKMNDPLSNAKKNTIN